jgi:hypothetical protein
MATSPRKLAPARSNPFFPNQAAPVKPDSYTAAQNTAYTNALKMSSRQLPTDYRYDVNNDGRVTSEDAQLLRSGTPIRTDIDASRSKPGKVITPVAPVAAKAAKVYQSDISTANDNYDVDTGGDTTDMSSREGPVAPAGFVPTFGQAGIPTYGQAGSLTAELGPVAPANLPVSGEANALAQSAGLAALAPVTSTPTVNPLDSQYFQKNTPPPPDPRTSALLFDFDAYYQNLDQNDRPTMRITEDTPGAVYVPLSSNQEYGDYWRAPTDAEVAGAKLQSQINQLPADIQAKITSGELFPQYSTTLCSTGARRRRGRRS